MDNKNDKLITEFHRLSGINEPINEGNSGAVDAINMLIPHLYHVDNSIDTEKAFEVLTKNPGLINLLPLSEEDFKVLANLTTAIKNNSSDEKLQKIINIVKSHL